jgi:hypothetical protein
LTIRDETGKVVFDGVSRGPLFLARLPQGRYEVTAKWGAWTFTKPVTLGADRERVVFSWKKVEPA